MNQDERDLYQQEIHDLHLENRDLRMENRRLAEKRRQSTRVIRVCKLGT